MRIRILGESIGPTTRWYVPTNRSNHWDESLLVTNFLDDPSLYPEIDDARDLLNGKGWVKV